MTRRKISNGEILKRFAYGLVVWPIEAWALMLTIGIIHNDVAPELVRPVGYGWTVFALTSLLPVITTTTAWTTRRTAVTGEM